MGNDGSKEAGAEAGAGAMNGASESLVSDLESHHTDHPTDPSDLLVRWGLVGIKSGPSWSYIGQVGPA